MLTMALVSLFVLVVVEHRIVPPRPAEWGWLQRVAQLRPVDRAAVRRDPVQQPAGPRRADAAPDRALPGVPRHREGLSRCRARTRRSRASASPARCRACWRCPALGLLAGARGDRRRAAARRRARWAWWWPAPVPRWPCSALVGFAAPAERPPRDRGVGRPASAGSAASAIYALSPGPVTRVRLRGENASSLRGGRRLLGGQLGSRPPARGGADRGRAAGADGDRHPHPDRARPAGDRRGQRGAPARRPVPRRPGAAAARGARARGAAPAEEPPAPVRDRGRPGAHDGHRARAARAAAGRGAGGRRGRGARAAGREPRRRRPPRQKPHRRLRRRPRHRRRRNGADGSACRSAARGRSTALVLLPLVGAGAAWGIGLMLDRMPDPGTDLGAAHGARARAGRPGGHRSARSWPGPGGRASSGVVVAGGLAAAVFVGRSLIGA